MDNTGKLRRRLLVSYSGEFSRVSAEGRAGLGGQVLAQDQSAYLKWDAYPISTSEI